MKKIILPALLLVLLLCSISLAQDKSVEFKYKFNPGDIDKYKLSLNLGLNMPNVPIAAAGIPTKFSVSLVTRQKVLGILQDGTAKVNVSYSDLKFDAPGMPPDVMKKIKNEKLPEISVNMKLSKDGRILSMEPVGKDMKGMSLPSTEFSGFMGQLGQFGVFPTWPVKVGDGWKQTIPFPFGGGDMKITSLLEAAATPVGKNNASKIKQTFESHIELADLFKAVMSSLGPNSDQMPQQAGAFLSSMTGGIDVGGWGVSYFLPDKGKLLKANANMKASINIGMPQQAIQQGAPSQINMSVDMVMNVSKIQ